MTYFKYKKIHSIIISFAIVVLLSLAPTQKVYAYTGFGGENSLNSIIVPTVGTVIGILSAVGFRTASVGYDAYEKNVVQPIVNYLKGYEVSNGKMRAYYKDGKTYVDKDVVQGVVDYASSQNMFTNIKNSSSDIAFGEFLDASGIMDAESFFMSVPYYAQWKQAVPSDYPIRLEKYGGVPYYSYIISNDDLITYNFGLVATDKSRLKYFKMSELESSGRKYMKINFMDELYRNISLNSSERFNGSISLKSDGSLKYDCNYQSFLLWTTAPKNCKEFGYRIGLTKQIVNQPLYTVADPAIAGQQIDNWNPAWAQNVIDVLKDLEINTSIDADSVAGADADRRGLALPVTLPQYGIDARSQTEAWEKTASIGMDVAQTGEVALSPSAVAELSKSIAQATGEAVHDAVGDITVSIPDAKYGDLDSYKLTLTDVFPFCIPFDLIDLVKVFSATPEAPKFSLPLKYPTGFNTWETYDFEVDLSVFDGVAEVVRTLETILFILGLIKITRSSMIRG